MTELTAETASALIPARTPSAAKWAFGRVLLCCGSAAAPGAAVLATLGALRSGVGLCRLASVPSVLAAAAVRCPAAMQLPLNESAARVISADALPLLSDDPASAVLFGCGIGCTDDGRALLRGLLTHVRGTLVLDADALNLLAEQPALLHTRQAPTLLTPHARELARLCGRTDAGIGDAVRFAQAHRVTLLCKGSVSTVVTPEGAVFRLDAPNDGLAKGGSGDLLAGLIAGLAAQGCPPAEAAALGAYLHSRAGHFARLRRGARAMLPDDVADALSDAWQEAEKKD